MGYECGRNPADRWEKPRCARGWIDRSQWPRHIDHNRRMPAEPCSATQSGDEEARLRKSFRAVSGSENYEALRENIRRLRDATTEGGKPLATIDLPMPAAVYFEGRRLPASYANFYIANGVVLVPVFNDPNDRSALDILSDIVPDRDVVGIYCGDLIWGFGAIHCMTQQQPVLSEG